MSNGLHNLPLYVMILAFIFAAALIPMSKRKIKGPFVRAWRLAVLILLVLAAFLAMVAPGLNLK